MVGGIKLVKVVLTFGVPGDTSRVRVQEEKCDEVVLLLCRFTLGQAEREGRHFRAALRRKAGIMPWHGVAEDENRKSAGMGQKATMEGMYS